MLHDENEKLEPNMIRPTEYLFIARLGFKKGIGTSKIIQNYRLLSVLGNPMGTIVHVVYAPNSNLQFVPRNMLKSG